MCLLCYVIINQPELSSWLHTSYMVNIGHSLVSWKEITKITSNFQQKVDYKITGPKLMYWKT